MEMECTHRQDKPPMSTWTGRLIYLPEMTPPDVSRKDIAHALSLICRGGGHIRHFYSVAQHSINCAMEAAARGYSPRVQLAALLHDGGEAYLSDLIRPVKALVKDYAPLEAHVDDCVRKAFGLSLTGQEWAQVGSVDDAMLHHEFLALRDDVTIYKTAPQRAGNQDFSQRDPCEVEAEFLKLLSKLEAQA
ncbi:MAG TPA: hypothetical protein VN446_08505 [Candidatus Acidoferrum sp.]|nr:hypothetical protein [Candidatus Acidoferrum sp.]